MTGSLLLTPVFHVPFIYLLVTSVLNVFHCSLQSTSNERFCPSTLMTTSVRTRSPSRPYFARDPCYCLSISVNKFALSLVFMFPIASYAEHLCCRRICRYLHCCISSPSCCSLPSSNMPSHMPLTCLMENAILRLWLQARMRIVTMHVLMTL